MQNFFINKQLLFLSLFLTILTYKPYAHNENAKRDDNEIIKALSPFGQVETSLSRSTSGAGLGLTLVKSLMELHGGGLELVSQKGIGTTATIVFPKKRVALKIASTRKNDDETSAPQEKEGDESTNHTLQ